MCAKHGQVRRGGPHQPSDDQRPPLTVQGAGVAAALQAVVAVVLVAAGQPHSAAVDGFGDGERRRGALLVEALAPGGLCDLARLELGCTWGQVRVVAVIDTVSIRLKPASSEASPGLHRSMLGRSLQVGAIA